MLGTFVELEAPTVHLLYRASLSLLRLRLSHPKQLIHERNDSWVSAGTMHIMMGSKVLVPKPGKLSEIRGPCWTKAGPARSRSSSWWGTRNYVIPMIPRLRGRGGKACKGLGGETSQSITPNMSEATSPKWRIVLGCDVSAFICSNLVSSLKRNDQ